MGKFFRRHTVAATTTIGAVLRPAIENERNASTVCATMMSDDAQALLVIATASPMELATFRRKIGVFGIAVNGADEAEPAQGGGRGLKISDELLCAARERRAFPLRGQC